MKTFRTNQHEETKPHDYENYHLIIRIDTVLLVAYLTVIISVPLKNLELLLISKMIVIFCLPFLHPVCYYNIEIKHLKLQKQNARILQMFKSVEKGNDKI